MTNEKVITILNSLKQYYNDKNEDSYVGFDNEDNEAIDMAIKALEQTSWIPVREKPTEGKYLITGAYGKNRYVDIATFDGEDATDTYAWDSYSDEYKVNRREHKVIAYMPLPQPYKAESEDEK